MPIADYTSQFQGALQNGGIAKAQSIYDAGVQRMAGNQADINAWQDQYKKATSNVDMPKTTPSVNSNPNPIAGKTPITPPAISPNPNPPTTPVTPIQAGVTPVSNPVNTGLTAGRRNQIISNLYQGMQYTPGNFANQDAFKKAYGYTGKTPDEQKIMDDFWAKNKIDSNITPNTNPLRSSFIANKLNKQNIQQSIDNDQKIATQINGYLAQGKTLDQIQSALQSNPKYTNNTALNESVNKFVTNYTNQLTNDINTKVAANPDIIKDQTTFRNTFDYNNLPAAKKAIVDNYFNSKTNGSTNQSDIQNATTHMGESVPVQAATQSLSDIETQKNNTYTNIANSRQSFIQDQFKKIYGPIDEQFKTQLDKLNQDEADTRTWETKLESTIKDQLDLGLANIAAQQNAAESQALGSASGALLSSGALSAIRIAARSQPAFGTAINDLRSKYITDLTNAHSVYLDKLKSIQDDEELSVVQRKQLSDILYQAIDATNQDLTKLKQGDAADAVAPLITAAGARISDVSSVTTGQQKDAMKNTAYIDAAKRGDTAAQVAQLTGGITDPTQKGLAEQALSSAISSGIFSDVFGSKDFATASALIGAIASSHATVNSLFNMLAYRGAKSDEVLSWLKMLGDNGLITPNPGEDTVAQSLASSQGSQSLAYGSGTATGAPAGAPSAPAGVPAGTSNTDAQQALEKQKQALWTSVFGKDIPMDENAFNKTADGNTIFIKPDYIQQASSGATASTEGVGVSNALNATQQQKQALWTKKFGGYVKMDENAFNKTADGTIFIKPDYTNNPLPTDIPVGSVVPPKTADQIVADVINQKKIGDLAKMFYNRDAVGRQNLMDNYYNSFLKYDQQNGTSYAKSISNLNNILTSGVATAIGEDLNDILPNLFPTAY